MSMSIPLHIDCGVSVFFWLNHKVKEVNLEGPIVLDLVVLWDLNILIIIRYASWYNGLYRRFVWTKYS